MRVLRLPPLSGRPATEETRINLADEFSDAGVDCQILQFSGHLWLRISANVYSTREDYMALRDHCISVFQPEA